MTSVADTLVAEDYAAQLRRDRENDLASQIWTGSSGWNSPSQLGHPCLRFLVLKRTRGTEAKPVSIDLQARFEMGNLIGNMAVQKLLSYRWQVTRIEGTTEWPAYQIRGRPDYEAKPPEAGRDKPARPFEVKSVQSNLFSGIHSYKDVRDHRNWRVRSWLSQLMCYELLDGHPEGLLQLVSLAGPWEIIPVPLDMEVSEGLLQKSEAVNAHMAAGTEPEPICDPDVCPGCQFFMTPACSVTLSMAPDTAVVTDEDDIEAVRRMLELKPLASEYEAMRKRLGVRFEGVTQALVPDLAMVTGKQVERNVKAQEARVDRYWSLKYLPLAASGDEEEGAG